MLSTNPSALSKLESTSQDLAAPVTRTLAALAADPPRHARFLNTLALMEHIGSRKIMASQSRQQPGHDTLKHLAEEARHAFFFKRAAEKLARRDLGFGPKDAIAPAAARAYMGRLDGAIARAVGEKGPLAYLYMSLIVELRAIWFYRLYEGVLTRARLPIALKSVLAEEELHLSEMGAHLADMDGAFQIRLAQFAGIENRRFRALWAAIEAG